jgi:hypothetical protein
LQAYVVEGGGLKPVSGELAKLSEAYWIDIYEPTPAEQKAVEQALDIRLRLPEEPAKFQISTPVRSTGTITLTALLLAGFDVRRPQLVTVQFIRAKGPLVTVTKGGSGGTGVAGAAMRRLRSARLERRLPRPSRSDHRVCHRPARSCRR